jgi:4-hydroxyacetophenone monooxygenase
VLPYETLSKDHAGRPFQCGASHLVAMRRATHMSRSSRMASDSLDREGVRLLDVTELERIVRSANIPTLLMVVFQVTGDLRWLQPPYRPSKGKGLDDNDSGGLPKEVQGEIRHASALAFHSLLTGNPPAIDVPTSEQTSEMLGACVGEPVDNSYGEMLSQEFRRRLGPKEVRESDAPHVPANFRVLIIGAGVSGIIAAQQLDKMGVHYVIVDGHDGPGGNWKDNPYPGAGVDTPSHLYTFSFAQRDWEHHFELRTELLEYFTDAFDATGARPFTRFRTHAVKAAYDDTTSLWNVELVGPSGDRESLVFNAIVSGVGVLNQAKIPRIPGMETFSGFSFHSSYWPRDLELAGKQVVIVGSGASAMQIAPAVVHQVDHLTIFQRTPPWVAPFEKFQLPISEDNRYLLRTFPLYRAWYWLKLYWQFGDKILDSLRKDPDWPHPERSVNARNDGHRKYFTRYIRQELEGRTDLIPKVLPSYPPYGKRILLDNGWYKTLCEPNVTLVDEAVVEVTPRGVVSQGGQEYDADVLVWATGFDSSRFVSSLEVLGRSGQSLREAWDDDDARAYLGVSVPGFPNFFMLGGPNSFPGSGSFMYFMEVQMRYVTRLMQRMFDEGIRSVDVRRDIYDEYNELVDKTSETTVWTHPGTNTFFRNDRGRLVFVSPFRNVEYWTRAEESSLEDYVLEARSLEEADTN